ncbi:MAG: SulP family inorganic anion transporter [Bacteroidia bacterium]|nr:SulP family inorganic anion transporter [Bacteroidia bacterium]MDW8058018.1 SulP family inorganic anion transporter [Bacteroidia bacterium]
MSLRRDLIAGLVVSFVALPLCIGIAIASELPAAAGLLGGIVGGLIVPIVSRSPLGISAPAAGLIVVVAQAVRELSPIQFALSVIIAGMTQIFLGLIRGHIISYFIPTPVIYGMLAGIGGIVLLKQGPQVIGIMAGKGFDGIVWSLPADKSLHVGAAIVGLFSLALLISWESVGYLKAIGRWIPGPLVAVLGGIGMGLILPLIHSGLAIPSFLSVSIPEEGIQVGFALSGWDGNISAGALKHGVLIGLVAAVESLLSAEAVSKLDPLGRPTPKRREIFAQGVGNITAGLIGAIPIAQVIIRSTTAVQAGGYSRMTAFFDGFFLAIFSFILAPYLKYLPLASISAVLVFVGYKLVRPAIFQRFLDRGFVHQFLPFLTTFVGVVLIDLLSGVLIGLGISLFLLLGTGYRFKPSMSLAAVSDRWILHLGERIGFLDKARLYRLLSKVPAGAHLVIDASQVRYLDADIRDALTDYKQEARRKGVYLELPTLLQK